MFTSIANESSREDNAVWDELVTRAQVISSNHLDHDLSYEQGDALLSLAYSWDPSSKDWTDKIRKNMNDFKQDLEKLQEGDEAVRERMKRDLETRQLNEDQPEPRKDLSQVWDQWFRLQMAVRSGDGAELTQTELVRLSEWMMTMSPVDTIWGDGTWVDATKLGKRLKLLQEGSESEKEESLKGLRATTKHLALA